MYSTFLPNWACKSMHSFSYSFRPLFSLKSVHEFWNKAKRMNLSLTWEQLLSNQPFAASASRFVKLYLLTHFRPMFCLCRNQVVGFHWQNVWKTPGKSDILNKDARQWPASLLKMSIFHRCFSNILLVKNQLPGLSISGTLVKNGLSKYLFWKFDVICRK